MPGIAYRDATHVLNDRFLVEKGRETLVRIQKGGEEGLALERERRWFVLKSASIGGAVRDPGPEDGAQVRWHGGMVIFVERDVGLY